MRIISLCCCRFAYLPLATTTTKCTTTTMEYLVPPPLSRIAEHTIAYLFPENFIFLHVMLSLLMLLLHFEKNDSCLGKDETASHICMCKCVLNIYVLTSTLSMERTFMCCKCLRMRCACAEQRQQAAGMTP